jgi:hypothetical protein
MKIRLSELKRIIASEVALASGNIRGAAGRSLYDEDDDMLEADEQKSKSSKKRPTPRMPKRGRHDVTRTQKRPVNESVEENEVRLTAILDEPDIQVRLLKLLKEYEHAETLTADDEPEVDMHSIYPYSYAVSNEISNVIDEMLSAGFTRSEIENFDPRMSKHLLW